MNFQRLIFLSLVFLPIGSAFAAPVCVDYFVDSVPVLAAQSPKLNPAQFFKTFPQKTNLKIGIYFGTFDPVHEGHMDVAANAIKFGQLDMIVFVPNKSTPHKAQSSDIGTRLDMLKIRLAAEDRMNLLLDDGGIIAKLGRPAFFSAVKNMTGAHEVYQIIGQDSYDSQRAGKKINPDISWKVLVFPRGNTPLKIPATLASVVQAVPVPDLELSSTKIRKMITAGANVPANLLYPDVIDYIQDQRLYGSPALLTLAAKPSVNLSPKTDFHFPTVPMGNYFIGETSKDFHPEHPRPAVTRYLGAAEKESLRVIFSDGLPYAAAGKLMNYPSDHAMNYVMDSAGNFYIFDQVKDPSVRHSSILGGQPVAGAGEMMFVGTRLVKINFNSGHYKDSKSLAANVLGELAAGAVELPKVYVER